MPKKSDFLYHIPRCSERMQSSKWRSRRLVQLFKIPSLTLSSRCSNVCFLIGSSFLIFLYRAMIIACCITFNTAAGWRPGCLGPSPSCTYINKFTKCSLGRIIMDQSLYIAGNLDLVFCSLKFYKCRALYDSSWERKATVSYITDWKRPLFCRDLDVNKTNPVAF